MITNVIKHVQTSSLRSQSYYLTLRMQVVKYMHGIHHLTRSQGYSVQTQAISRTQEKEHARRA